MAGILSLRAAAHVALLLLAVSGTLSGQAQRRAKVAHKAPLVTWAGDSLARFAENNSRYGPAIVDSLNRLIGPSLGLRQPVRLVVSECGGPLRDGYSPKDRLIVLCSESFEWANGHQPWAALDLPSGFARLMSDSVNVLSGTYLAAHELAHATILDLRIPLVGDEETTVDELAAVLLARSVVDASSGLSAVYEGKDMFHQVGEFAESRSAFQSHHGSSTQRSARLACRYYGLSTTPPQASLGDLRTLPVAEQAQSASSDSRHTQWEFAYAELGSAERVNECSGDTSRAVSAWKAILGRSWKPAIPARREVTR
jgi:hypothetical protein